MGRVERHDHERHVLSESNTSVGAGCGHQEVKHWNWLSSTCLRGMFRNARAYRSPTCVGVDWSSVEIIVTLTVPGGRVMRDIFPIRDKVSEQAACSLIGGSSDTRYLC